MGIFNTITTIILNPIYELNKTSIKIIFFNWMSKSSPPKDKKDKTLEGANLTKY